MKLTPEQLTKIMDDNDLDMEELLDSIVDWLEEDRKAQTHELIIACLDGAIGAVKIASFDYYVSTK